MSFPLEINANNLQGKSNRGESRNTVKLTEKERKKKKQTATDAPKRTGYMGQAGISLPTYLLDKDKKSLI